MARLQQDNIFKAPVVTPNPVDLSKVDVKQHGSLYDQAILARLEAIEALVFPKEEQKEEQKETL